MEMAIEVRRNGWKRPMHPLQALSSVILFIRLTATDPTDNTHLKNKKKKGKSKGLQKLNYGHVLAQILRSIIRRKYIDPLNTGAFIELLLPFSPVTKDDTVLLDLNEEDITYCSLCNHEVKQHSKRCRTCNRCVEGFDHHCRVRRK